VCEVVCLGFVVCLWCVACVLQCFVFCFVAGAVGVTPFVFALLLLAPINKFKRVQTRGQHDRICTDAVVYSQYTAFYLFYLRVAGRFI
jgi:hypothetical protein